MVGNILRHHHLITQSVSWCAEMMSRGVMEGAAGDGQNSMDARAGISEMCDVW